MFQKSYKPEVKNVILLFFFMYWFSLVLCIWVIKYKRYIKQQSNLMINGKNPERNIKMEILDRHKKCDFKTCDNLTRCKKRRRKKQKLYQPKCMANNLYKGNEELENKHLYCPYILPYLKRREEADNVNIVNIVNYLDSYEQCIEPKQSCTKFNCTSNMEYFLDNFEYPSVNSDFCMDSQYLKDCALNKIY